MNQIKNDAIGKYTGFGGLLDKGMTMSQIADPYVQSMQRILETTDVDWTKDPTIQKALGTTIGPDGTSQATPLWQFEQGLRSDPRWAYTNNARDYVNGVIHQIGRDFGMVG